MIESLQVKAFRGFQDLTVGPLKQINLIAGESNSGKTALLESLCLGLSSDTTQLTQLPVAFRSGHAFQTGALFSDNVKNFWECLLFDRDVEATATIAVQFKDQPSLVSQFTAARGAGGMFALNRLNQAGNIAFVQPGGCVNGSLTSTGITVMLQSTRLTEPGTDAELYNQVSLTEGAEERILELMRILDPRLQRLRYAKVPGTSQPLVYASFGNGLKNALPVSQTGQGFSKLLSLFCQMLASDAQVVLIDEFEHGLHFSALPQIWKGLAGLAATEEVQIVATTHSYECIAAAHQVFAETPDYNFALHRLQRVKGRIEAVTHSQEMLEVALKNRLEMR